MKSKVLQEISTGEKKLRLHLLGVAGSGMSGLAGLFLQLGHEVSGSDRVASDEVRRLQTLGLRFSTPHTAAATAGVDAVIYSSAIKPGNVAYDAALAAQIPLIRRAEALAAIVRRRDGILVSGTHGKTTTSSLAAHVLRTAGLHPGHYVGAEIPILGTNAHWDETGKYFVAEGDESDGTLVEFTPAHTIVLNIEEEHLDHYKDWEDIAKVFRKVLDQTSDLVVYCAEDVGAKAVCSGHSRAISYGWSETCDYSAADVRVANGGSRFTVLRKGEKLADLYLGVAGKHNVLNALAVIALASELGVDAESIRVALEGFRGARRRFETRYRSKRFHLVDDYGHHPSEVEATLLAARAQGAERVLCLFQPHRYSRTLKLREHFGAAFHAADNLWVADVYPASELPIEGVDGGMVSDAVNGRSENTHKARFVPELQQARLAIGNGIRCGDLVLTLGAGNVHECASPLARDLAMADAIIDASCEQDLHLRLYEPMRKHSTLMVGGAAQVWVEPSTKAGFKAIADYCRNHEIPLLVVGRGSNLVVLDGGIPGVVMHPVRGEFSAIQIDGHRIKAGAGVRMKALAWAARDAGIGGFEWMEGIPGNVGGALRMNAGAMGVQTFDQVVSVELLRKNGTIEQVSGASLDPVYRNVPALATDYALEATFTGRADTPVADIDALLNLSKSKRRATQPVAASAGCFFKNPAEIAAGKLIDELGLKGLRVGAAVVSGVHGNFIVNEGGASAHDFLVLIEKIKRHASETRGVRLDTEVQIIGEEILLF